MHGAAETRRDCSGTTGDGGTARGPCAGVASQALRLAMLLGAKRAECGGIEDVYACLTMWEGSSLELWMLEKL